MIKLARFEGFSEKAKLYMEHFDIISEFEDAFKSDTKSLFGAIEDEIKSQDWFDGDEWKIETTTFTIRIYKHNWIKKRKGIYFYIAYGKWEIKKKEVYMSLYFDPTKNREHLIKRLSELSKEKHDELRRKNYRVQDRGANFIIKKFAFNEGTIVEDVVEHLNDIIFLGKYIDEALKSTEGA